MSDYPILSPEGKKKFEAELSVLKTAKRKEISERIELAKEHGDLSENAEYQQAREEQAFIEGRILELENILKNAVVASNNDNSRIQIGSTVILADNNKELKFSIVGSHEGNPAQGLLSCDSPLGQAVLGRTAGEDVKVETPRGIIVYTIKSIS